MGQDSVTLEDKRKMGVWNGKKVGLSLLKLLGEREPIPLEEVRERLSSLKVSLSNELILSRQQAD